MRLLTLLLYTHTVMINIYSRYLLIYGRQNNMLLDVVLRRFRECYDKLPKLRT